MIIDIPNHQIQMQNTTDQGYPAINVDCECGKWAARSDTKKQALNAHLRHVLEVLANEEVS